MLSSLPPSAEPVGLDTDEAGGRRMAARITKKWIAPVVGLAVAGRQQVPGERRRPVHGEQALPAFVDQNGAAAEPDCLNFLPPHGKDPIRPSP